MEFAILALLFVKHFVCDFVVQAEYMIREKGIYGADGGVHHAWLHSLGTWAVLFPFTDLFTATSMSALDGVVHYHVDWLKCQFSAQWQPHHWAYWVGFGLDQLAHALTYIAIVAIIVL